MLTALVRNWWMMVVRGGLAMAFGLVLLLSRRVTLDGLVLLFGVYAVLDGIWATVAARRASSRPLGAWPIALGGVVSVALGVLAIVGPFLAQSIVQLIAAWGLMVGGLEIIGARSSRPVRLHAIGCSAPAACGRYFLPWWCWRCRMGPRTRWSGPWASTRSCSAYWSSLLPASSVTTWAGARGRPSSPRFPRPRVVAQLAHDLWLELCHRSQGR